MYQQLLTVGLPDEAAPYSSMLQQQADAAERDNERAAPPPCAGVMSHAKSCECAAHVERLAATVASLLSEQRLRPSEHADGDRRGPVADLTGT